MIRSFFIAAAISVACAGAVLAQTPWTEDGSTFAVTLPKGWGKPDKMSGSAGTILEYAAGNANEECVFYRFERIETATATPGQLKAAWGQPIGAVKWADLTKPLSWSTGAPVVADDKVEAVGDWPVQIATITGNNGPVTAALHARPGSEIWVFCQSYDGKDRKASFRATANSVTTPKDAEFAAAEAADAAKAAEAKAAAEAAAAAAAAAAAEKDKKKRR
jgi:hypothetical protein